VKLRERLTVVFIYFTVVLFVASLAAHASLYAGFNLRLRFPQLWFLLNVSILVGFIPLGVGYLSKRFADVPPPAPPPYVWGSASYISEYHWASFVLGVAIGITIFAYPLFNFFYYETLLNGYPEIIDGKYFMHFYHGGGLRQISPEVFASKSLYYARKLSGHWMAFHLIAFMFLMESLKAAPNSSLCHRFKNLFTD
jgi:hypothetical protein